MHFTPERSWKVMLRPSAEGVHDVASTGLIPLPPKAWSASGSSTLLETKKTPLLATMAPFQLGGSLSAATISTPPRLPWA
jgi:hypothetical protein